MRHGLLISRQGAVQESWKASTTLAIGSTTIGTTQQATGINRIQASSFAAAAAGPLRTLEAYIDGNGTASSGTEQIYMVAYADASGVPGSLLSYTNPVSVTKGQAPGWVSFPWASSEPTLVQGTHYWLGFETGGTANVIQLYLDATANGHVYNLSTAYTPPPPSTFPTPTNATGIFSIVGYL